jgi:hypothetical protein
MSLAGFLLQGRHRRRGTRYPKSGRLPSATQRIAADHRRRDRLGRGSRRDGNAPAWRRRGEARARERAAAAAGEDRAEAFDGARVAAEERLNGHVAGMPGMRVDLIDQEALTLFELAASLADSLTRHTASAMPSG